jgi:RND family efflux transporter MFP subunit
MRKTERDTPGPFLQGGQMTPPLPFCLSLLLPLLLPEIGISLQVGRWTELLFLVVILAAAIAFLVSALVVASRARSTLVEVAPVRRPESPQRSHVQATGYVTARRRATVAPTLAGRVKEVLVEEGTRVVEGQVLALLDDSDARAHLASATADHNVLPTTLAELHVSLSKAKREVWRAQALPQEGGRAQEAFEAAQTVVQTIQSRIASAEEQMRAAEARIAAAEREVENCLVRSPFSGVVISQEAQPGEMVSPGSAGGFTRSGIATIVDLRSLEIEADVDESLVGRIQPGQNATAMLQAYPDWRIPARVRAVIPNADRERATVKVRVAMERLDPRILPNMAATVAFFEGAEAGGPAQGGGMLIPEQALREEEGKSVVYLYHDGKVERRTVRATLGRHQDAVEVIAGLAESDRVVVKGFQGLRDGRQVALKP